MLAAAKECTVLKPLYGLVVGADLVVTGGRPTFCVKQRARAAQGSTVVGSQASTEGSAEIATGRANFQQGLAATCKDLMYKGKTEA